MKNNERSEYIFLTRLNFSAEARKIWAGIRFAKLTPFANQI